MRRSPFRSKRRRQLYWTIGLLCAGAVAGLSAGIWVYRANRPPPYRPGVKSTDVTNRLSLRIPEAAPLPRFNDVTQAAGLSEFQSFAAPRTSQLPEDMGSGAAWGDYDNDGDDDLFLVSNGGALNLPASKRAPSELFENLGNGAFRRVHDFPETRIIGMGANWGDYDGDGWLDLVVTGYNSIILFHNHQGTFQRDDSLPASPGYWAGAAWGDFDNDRDLDLYICGYVQYKPGAEGGKESTRQYGKEVPFTLNPSSYAPEKNLLFRNNGNGTFTEVAETLGVSNPKGRSLNALWHDFNDDGWLDIYVSNDISDNVLFLNKGGTFDDISHAAWVADYRGAMGLAAGDWDGDGDEDLFVTHWIAQENALYDSLLEDLAGQKSKPPSTLQKGSVANTSPSSLDAEPPVRFMDVADMRGLGQIALRVVGWGTEFADLDSDGWLDLLVANGSTFETTDVPPRLRPQNFFLFWNHFGKSYHNLAPLHEPLAEKFVGRGLAVSDYDGDGDLDFVIITHGEGARLFRNDMDTGNWLTIRLRSRSGFGGEPTGRGEGTRLIAHVKARRLRRTVGGASYLSQSSRNVHFGLGPANRIDLLEIQWHGGGKDQYRNLAANTHWMVTEGDPAPRLLATGGKSMETMEYQPKRGSDSVAAPAEDAQERRRLVAFWSTQRAAVRALKAENDLDKAIGLFREALSLNPNHEDSLYFLGQSLVRQGDVEGGLEALKKLTRVNPTSHRGHQQWGMLRARSAKTAEELSAAEAALEQALKINPEETGVLILLGEIDMMQGQTEHAGQLLTWACRTNPKASVGFYLLGYLAWKRGDNTGATDFLRRSSHAGKKDKRPAGSTAEGDVRIKMHSNTTLLSAFYESSNGQWDDLERTFGALDKHLKGLGRFHGDANE